MTVAATMPGQASVVNLTRCRAIAGPQARRGSRLARIFGDRGPLVRELARDIADPRDLGLVVHARPGVARAKHLDGVNTDLNAVANREPVQALNAAPVDQ